MPVTPVTPRSNKNLLLFHGWINLSLKKIIGGSEKTSCNVKRIKVISRLGILSASLINSAAEEMNKDEITHSVIPKKATLFAAGDLTSVVTETSPVTEYGGRAVSSCRLIVVNSSPALSAVLVRLDSSILWWPFLSTKHFSSTSRECSSC